jgi:hypothetical protein
LSIEYEVDSFPQTGSVPWLNHDNLNAIRQNLVEITYAGRCGVGILMKQAGKINLLTVAHVVKRIEEGSELTLNGVKVIAKKLRSLGGNEDDDPVVSVRVKVDKQEEELAYNPAGEFEQLTMAERDLLACLIVMNPTGKAALIHDFSIRKGVIHASVNLRRGDSGSPVFGVLRNSGLLRYVGAVSRGNFNEVGGNIIALIESPICVGSPGVKYVEPEPIVRKKKPKKEEVPDEEHPICRLISEHCLRMSKKSFRNVSFEDDIADPRQVLTETLEASDVNEDDYALAIQLFDAGDIERFNAERGKFSFTVPKRDV